MKRKHPHNSAGKGCQIISKFFKTSSTQVSLQRKALTNNKYQLSNTSVKRSANKNVKDASKRVTDSVVVSKVSLAVPVLQKLTKLRESLSRRALYTDPVGFYRNKKNDKMEEHGKAHPENKPECATDNSNATMIEANMKESSKCDVRDSPASLHQSTVISISSDSSLENMSKSLGSDQTPVNMDTEEECLLEDKDPCGFQGEANIDDQDTGFVKTLDIEVSCETETNGDDKSIDVGIDQEACVGHVVADICEKVDEAEKRNSDNNQCNENVTDTGPIGMDSHFSCHEKLTDTEVTYDSQLAYDTVNNQGNDELGSDSDDDLLSPTQFLYEKTSKPVVHTPEKITTPLGASPMSSPVKPVKNVMRELDEQKYRFSVNKLLKEKNRKEVKNAVLIKIEADLDDGIKKGGIKSMTDMISEDEADSEMDDGKDLSQCKLPKEVSKHLVKVSNFSEDLVGEDIFPKLHNKILKYEMPTLNIPPPPNEEDTFCSNLLSSKPDAIKELINGGWIMQYYLKRPCPDAVAEWVFHIMCFYPDTFVSSQCFKTLWALLRAGTEEQGGVPKGVRGMTWVPSIKSIILVLQHYGATLESITPNELRTAGMFTPTCDIMKREETFDIAKSDTSPCNQHLTFIMGQLIQFLTHCLHMAPLNFTVNDLHVLLVISCRLSLDLRLQEFLFDMEMLIFEVLNCFGKSQWEEQVKELPLLLVCLSTNHRDLLQILHVVPLSERGCQLRQLTCVILIHYLVKEFTLGQAISDSTQRNEILQSLNKTATFEVSELLSLVDEIQPKQTSNYHLLHTIISLFDLAIGNEDHPSSEQPELKKLANKLSSLNGDIKDPRAAYLDRTKVKDLLVRTVNKIHFFVQAIEPSLKERELTEYFETNSSDYEVHTLEETLPHSPVSEDDDAESISSPGEDSDGSNDNPVHDKE